MTELAEDKNRPRVLGAIQGYPIDEDTVIFEGGAVGLKSTGYTHNINGDDVFVGFCEQKVDNLDGELGDLDVRVLTRGTVKLDVTGVEVTDVGRPVYAEDEDSFALGGLGAKIGVVARFINPGVAEVYFDAFGVSVEVNTLLTFSIDLAGIVDGPVVDEYTLGFDGRIKSTAFVINEPVTTGSKGTNLFVNISGADLTDGQLVIYSAICTPMGAVIEGTPFLLGEGAFVSGDKLSIVAAGTTAFVEGSGSLILTLGA